MSRSPRSPAPLPPTTGPRPATDPLLHDQRRARRPEASLPLRRSGKRRMLGGVCGGIAEFTGAPAAAVRAVAALSLIPSIGVSALVYLLLWWMLPRA